MPVRCHRLSLPAILLLLSSPLAGADPATNNESNPALMIEDPYVRAVPPGQPNSAAFMTITNPGTADRAVVAAASSAAEVLELHTHRMEGGMMRMRQIERIDVPAGTAVALAPGGLHVMLIGLTAPLAPGDQVPLTLTLDDGASIALSAPVRSLLPRRAEPPSANP